MSSSVIFNPFMAAGLPFQFGSSGGGGGTPSAPLTSLQYNNAGAFGGTQYLYHTAGNKWLQMGPDTNGAFLDTRNATIEIVRGDNSTYNSTIEVYIQSNSPEVLYAVSGSNQGISSLIIDPVTATHNRFESIGILGQSWNLMTAGRTLDVGYGANLQHYASGGATTTEGRACFAQMLADTGSNILNGINFVSWMYDLGPTNDTNKAYHFYAKPSNTVRHAEQYGLWVGDFSGKAAYPGYIWIDDNGVLRIKSDSTFNGVSQAIFASYNPRFTKYTPNAANYERFVIQWETDVATLTTEKGGTGTLRALNIGDAGVQVKINSNNITLANSFTTSGNFTLTLTQTGNTNVTLPTSGTLATLAGAESLTNKKLGSLTTNGLVTTTGGDGTLSVTVLGTGVSTWLQTPSSANLAAAITDETGSAGKLVFSGAPTIDKGMTIIGDGTQLGLLTCSGAVTSGSHIAFALAFQPTFDSTITSLGASIWISPSLSAVAFTMATYQGLRISAPTLGAGSAITTNQSVYIADMAGIATTSYGIYQVGTGDINYFGGQVRFNTTIVPDTNDVAALGNTSLKWSDLFVASGAVINFNNGDVTLTHSGGVLTVGGSAANGVNITLAAGGTSRASLTFPVSSLVTTANDGDMEMDANCFYLCTDAGNRGVVPVMNYIRQHADRAAFANDTNQHAIFDSVTNGTLTLETGTYFFECVVQCKATSATSGNLKFDLKGAGGATLANILYFTNAIDAANDTLTAGASLSEIVSTQVATNIATATTATVCTFWVRGHFEVTGAGSIIPSVAQTTAVATAVITAGSWFYCHRVNSTSGVSVGQWT